jgi:hypothetical protein
VFSGGVDFGEHGNGERRILKIMEIREEIIRLLKIENGIDEKSEAVKSGEEGAEGGDQHTHIDIR